MSMPTKHAILGIDEVGRGCWAGPLVMGAVVLGDETIHGLTDSKALSKSKRIELADEIHRKASSVGLGWISAKKIDEIGLSAALKMACRLAVEQINCSYGEIIIDGTVNFLQGTQKGEYVTILKKADLLIKSVSAASIVAKVARDNYMTKMAQIYPEYSFDKHVGYGTLKHRQAITEHGACDIHRFSFAPLKKYSPDKNNSDVALDNNFLTTKQLGCDAENLVAETLRTKRHKIIAQNWRTKLCEIDIISVEGRKIFFTEVKYRKNDKLGSGMDAITPKKWKQIIFSAEIFLANNPQFDKFETVFLGASVSGEPMGVQEIIPL